MRARAPAPTTAPASVPEQLPNTPENRAAPRPHSLRFRLILLAALVMIIAMGLVGAALNTANHRAAVSSLQSRMESYVYLVLAAIELDQKGNLHIPGDLGDPRLSQPGSGIYLRANSQTDHWVSPSALGLSLPELSAATTGQALFSEPYGDSDFYSLRYGVSWQLEDDSIQPVTVSVLVDNAEIEQQTSAFRLGLWRSLGAVGVILLLAQSLLLYLGFRPLRKVASDVARIESGQAPRLEGNYPREIEPLARNVNHLLETEKSNQQRIRNALDSLAHSLKTPLAVIQAGLELRGGEAAKPMRNAADEMHYLIATRLERAGASARRTLAEPLEVRPQVQRIVDSLQKIHSHKLITVEFIMDENLLFYGEQRDLLELAGNLVDNAFKYGKSKIRISAGVPEAKATRPGLWLRIEDDGPGIDKSQREWLLQRGTRGDERRNRQSDANCGSGLAREISTPGTPLSESGLARDTPPPGNIPEGHGLGLAIVTELVSAYGGVLSINSSDLGGAMIRIEIPGT